ncbi:MAG: hypothetical protein INR68_14665 [Methylobacterium mesophilicum]|nr:hypothetical protein [Methylobacterium mesophilicum]
MRRGWTLLVLGFMLAACRESGGEGEIFAIQGKLIVFNYRVASATYLVTLKPLRPMQEGDVAVARFENPAGGADIEVRQRIWPKLAHVTIESPPLSCIRKNRPYRAAIRIEDARGALRQTLDAMLTSSEDQSLLPDRPLVVGPAYTPNPDLAGHPDGKLDEGPQSTCPSDN